ncbi:MAG: hypothetical protein AAGD35_04735, partial [Actinomycetota bacterium]
VKKGSFYFFFDSKQALAIEMLDRAWERTRSTIFAHSLADDTKGAVDAIDAYGHLLADNLERVEADSGVVTGCRFGNFAIELSTRDEEVRVRLASIFDEMIAIAASAIGRGVGSGELDPRTDPVAAATDVIVHMEGLMVLAKAHRRPALLRNLGPTIARLLAIQIDPDRK